MTPPVVRTAPWLLPVLLPITLATVATATPLRAGELPVFEYRVGVADGTTVDPSLEAPPAIPTTVSIFYRAPDMAVSGFQISIALSENLSPLPDFTIAGTIVDAVGAEFVDAEADDDTTDGDGKELVIGVLLDYWPPFENQVLPPTEVFTELGRVSIVAPSVDGAMGTIDFVDALDGLDGPAIDNILVVDGDSYSDFPTVGATLLATGVAFLRGDCNDDTFIDLADMIFILDAFFGGGEMPSCAAACDTNSDRGSNLADALYIGNYLFAMGPPPAAPFPDCGVAEILPGDPDCQSFDSCLP